MEERVRSERADLELALDATLAVLERPDLTSDETKALRARADYILKRLRTLGLPGEPGSGQPPAES